MRKLPLLLLLLSLAACSDDDGDKTQPKAQDMAPDASSQPDLDVEVDLPAPADMADDLATPADMADDMSSPDQSADDMSADMTDPDMSACMYIDFDVSYVRCGEFNMYSLLRKLEDRDLGAVACPVYYTLKGKEYPTAAAALAAEQCDASCQYTATMSVTFLHCERRNGYIKFTADGCPDIYEFAEGVYPSVELWRMANPCPG
jgi:hypothetical protein